MSEFVFLLFKKKIISKIKCYDTVWYFTNLPNFSRSIHCLTQEYRFWNFERCWENTFCQYISFLLFCIKGEPNQWSITDSINRNGIKITSINRNGTKNWLLIGMAQRLTLLIGKAINQYSVNILLYVCSHWGDIRQQEERKKKNVILIFPQDYEQSI